MRFDEVELEAVPLIEPAEVETQPAAPVPSPYVRHTLALLTDLSLFAALSLALSPLLPEPHTTMALTALAGFVLMLSYYYFAGAWVLWGKTIGGAIFDVRIEIRGVREASARWAWIVGTLIVASAITFFATTMSS